MRKHTKRLLAFLLTLAMLVSLVNVQQFSVTAEAPETKTEVSQTETLTGTDTKAKQKSVEAENGKTDKASLSQTDTDAKKQQSAKEQKEETGDGESSDDVQKQDAEENSESDETDRTDQSDADDSDDDSSQNGDKDDQKDDAGTKDEQEDEDSKDEETEGKDATEEDMSSEQDDVETSDSETSGEVSSEEIPETSTEATEVTTEEKSDTESIKAEETTKSEPKTEKLSEVSEATEIPETTKKKKIKQNSEEIEYLPTDQPDGVMVKVYAPSDAFPEGTTLSVSKLTGSTLDGTENILEDEVDYDGLLVYDISFHDCEGREIEPEKGSVRVSMQLNTSILPEGADKDTLTIQHLKETSSGILVETVAKVESNSIKVTDNKVNAEFEVDSFSEFVITYANNTNWTSWDGMPYPSTENKNNKSVVNFYLNLHSQIANSDEGGSSGAIEANFTPSVFKTVVSNHPQGGFEYTPEYINGSQSAYIIIQGTSSGSAYTVDNNIRQLSSSYASFTLRDFPTDEEVFNTIKNEWSSWDSSKRSISVNGEKINIGKLNTQNFEIRWYVFKYNLSDAWHIDGILVRKTGQLMIQKTFENVNADVISSLGSNFNINVSGRVQIGNNTQIHSYNLKLTDDIVEVTQTGNSYTYTWMVDVYNATYRVRESNAEVNNWSYSASYSAFPAIGEGSSGEYPEDGFDIHCITQASDESEVTQKASLTNKYSKNPVSLTITKRVTGLETRDLNILKNKLQFTVTIGEIEQTINFKDFTDLGNGCYQYIIPNCEPGESYNVTEKYDTLEGYDLQRTPFSGQSNGELELGTGATASFTNTYSQKNVVLTVTKKVYGNMGEKDKPFDFTLSLLKDGVAYEEELPVKDGEALTVGAEGEYNGKYLFDLEDGESIAITVPYGYSYTVEEVRVSGYETSVSVDGAEAVSNSSSTGTLNKNISLVFNNTKNVSSPTGLSGGSDSWMILLGAAAVLAVSTGLYGLRRRKTGAHD